MPRVRHRLARGLTDDRWWQEERAKLLAGHASLETCEPYWQREDGVPDDLRGPARRRDLLAVRPADRARLKAEYDAIVDGRRAWLAR